jgi:mRNA interferase RelE/StbE
VAYQLIVHRRAHKAMRGLRARDQERIVAHFAELAEDPRREGTKKLAGTEDRWRYRVGRDYRIIYSIDDGTIVVLVLDVEKRGDAYRKIGRL